MSVLLIKGFSIVIACLAGWLLAVFMGRERFPKNHLERAAVGPIWISIVAIVFFVMGAKASWVNLLCALSIAGFLVRSLMEFALRSRERAVAAEALELDSNPPDHTINDGPARETQVYPHRLVGTRFDTQC